MRITNKKPNNKYIEKIQLIVSNHYKKYQQRNMSLEDFDKLCGF
jgi:hypothetical protein